MKRIALLILLLSALLLSGCGAETAASAPADTAQPAPSPTAAPSLPPLSRREGPEADAEESARMASFLAANRALMDGTTLYTLDFSSKGVPELGRYRLMRNALRQYRTLVKDCVPEYLCLHEDKLYYRNANTGAIERVGVDGRGHEILFDGSCDYLQLVGDKLRFTDARHRLCEADLDGGNARVLIGIACYYPYSLGDTLLYQKDSEDEALFLHWMQDGKERRLTTGAAYAPLLWDGRLYYSTAEGLESVLLNGKDLQRYELPSFSGSLELTPWQGALALRGLGFAETPLQWTGSLTEQSEPEASGYRLLEYVGADFRVDAVYEPDRRIRLFVLTDSSGREYPYFAGQGETD